MNKKIVIIILALITTIVIAVVGVILFSNKPAAKTTPNPGKNVDSYYVVKGAETLAKFIKPAIEAYATQDTTESTTSRNERLKPYFAPDSPVYSRELEIRVSNSATKTIARVKLIKYATGEGVYPNLIIGVDLTNYSGSTKYTTSVNYWITLKQNSDGINIAEDIGTF